MPNSVIERAARALARYRYEHGADCQGLDREEWANEAWPEFVVEAQVVLQAIREPSEAMNRAGWVSDLPFTPSIKVDVVWQAMIDAALADG